SWMSSRPVRRQICRCDPLSRMRRFHPPLVRLSSIASSGACATSGAPPSTTAAAKAAIFQVIGFRSVVRIRMLRPTVVPVSTIDPSDQLPHMSDELLILDCELPRAERAIHENDAVLVAHVAPVFLGKTRQHVLEMHDRTAASA